MRAKIIGKISFVLIFTAFLTLMGFAGSKDSDQRTYTSKWTPKRNIVSINIGGLFSLVQVGYDYMYTDMLYGEDMTVSDYVENSEAFGFSAGAGFYIVDEVEIAASINIFSKSLNGLYGLSLPNVYLWEDIAFDEVSSSPVFKETMFHFAVNFHPLSRGNIRPFIGAGVSYVSGKMDLLNDIIYEETYYWNWSHEIEITEIEFEETNVNKWGFNFTGGMDLYLTNSVAFYASGRYIVAKQEVEHPLTTVWDKDETLELDLGGLSANLGIKVFF